MQFNPALNEVNTTEHIQGGHGQGACVARASSVVARVTDSCSFLIKQPAVGPELSAPCEQLASGIPEVRTVE